MATGFVADQSSPYVDNVPAFGQVTVAASGTETVTFLNMTKSIVVHSNADVLIGVSTAGTSGTANFRLRGTTGGGPTVPTLFPIQCKQIVFKNPSSTDAIYVSYCATLTRLESQNFDDLTTANGFEKV